MTLAGTLEANTVKTYATVGVVFYGIAILLELLGVITAFYLARPSEVPIMVMWASVPVILSSIFGYWAYSTYQQIDNGNFIELRSAALVIGIFGLGLGGFLGGLFFLLAYGKMGELLHYTRIPVHESVQTPTQIPTSPVPPAYPTRAQVCVNCGRMADANSHFCAYCGSQLPE